MSNISIYLTNLGKYNEGELIGAWVQLPVSDDELNDVLDRIGISEQPNEKGNYYEEYFITDYDSDLEIQIDEYESISTLNDIAEMVKDFGEDERIAFKAFKDEGYDLEYAVTCVQDCDYRIYSDCDDMEDVAREYVEETCLLSGVPEEVTEFFDFEAYGRYLEMEGNFVNVENYIVEPYR